MLPPTAMVSTIQFFPPQSVGFCSSTLQENFRLHLKFCREMGQFLHIRRQHPFFNMLAQSLLEHIEEDSMVASDDARNCLLEQLRKELRHLSMASVPGFCNDCQIQILKIDDVSRETYIPFQYLRKQTLLRNKNKVLDSRPLINNCAWLNPSLKTALILRRDLFYYRQERHSATIFETKNFNMASPRQGSRFGRRSVSGPIGQCRSPQKAAMVD
jgi:hypothetical protein